MISVRDQYEGAVLRHLARHSQYEKVIDLKDRHGHFRLNEKSYLLVKYSSSSVSPWRFTLRPDDLRTLVRDQNRAGLFGGSYVCLICGSRKVCVLNIDELGRILDLDGDSAQTIVVRHRPRSSLSVSGSDGRLKRKIPASRFPTLLFD